MKKNKVKKITEVNPKEGRFINPEERVLRFQESIELFYSSMEREWLSTLNTREGHVERVKKESMRLSKKGLETIKL